MAGAERPDDQNLTGQFLYLNTLLKMRDAGAEGRVEKYIYYFKFCLRSCMSYLEPMQREAMNEDWKILQSAIKKVLSTPASATNDETRKYQVRALELDFATGHEFYLFEVLPSMGIIKPSEEGVIDFTRMDLETLTTIIRSGGGLESTIARVMENQEGQPVEEAPKEEEPTKEE